MAINLFEDVVNEKALETLDKQTLEKLLELLKKVK